ncbi:MAG TPA: hypothetical protein VM760_08905 [Sphingomicrobium sp.]|nr:hypothetical protein [Sphingomicrobium sp.]
MDPLQFAYWLQGFAELNDGEPSPEQWQSIKDHLATVFQKVTPPLFDPRPQPYRPQPGTAADVPLRPLRAECIQVPKGIAATAIC